MKTVFLSSTSSELKEFREAAYGAIEGLDGYHCVRMEDFGARDVPPLETCLAEVAKCDLFVGVLGQARGSCPEGSDQSYTEIEFQAAASLHKPMLIFVSDEVFLKKSDSVDSSHESKAQTAFLERILTRHAVGKFSSPEGLSTKVLQAIRNWERPGSGGTWKNRTGRIVATVVLYLLLSSWFQQLAPLTPKDMLVVFLLSLAIVLTASSLGRMVVRRRRTIKAGFGLWIGVALASTAISPATGMERAMTLQSPQSPESDGGQANSQIVCVADKPTVEFDKPINVRFWTSPDLVAPLTIRWEAENGSITTRDNLAYWTAPSSEGTFTVTGVVTDEQQKHAECTLRLTAREPDESTGRGGETGRSLLVNGKSEADSYGLYSYFVLGSQPTTAMREAYLAALGAYLRLVPEISRLEEYFRKQELNVTYVPVRATPPADEVTNAWVLQQYDYARARFILSRIDPSLQKGPYLISAAAPIASGMSMAAPEILFMDLSGVPPDLMEMWMSAFVSQAAQERFTEPRRIQDFSLKMRTLVGVIATAIPSVQDILPNIQTLLSTWIRMDRLRP